MERVFLRRFTARPLAQMTMTMGFALLLRDLAFMIWGGDPFTLPVPAIEHDIDVAFAFAEQVTVLYQGRVLAEGHRMAIAADRRVQAVYLGVNS